MRTPRTAEHASLQTAWEAYGAELGRPLPNAAGIAITGLIEGKELRLTNNPWVIRSASITKRLGVSRYRIVKDFGAVAHAVGQLAPVHFCHLCGEDRPLPTDGVISVVGPCTGLGVAMLLR